MQTENLRYDYDDKFDVLYVALGDRKNSYGDDSQDGVIYLKDTDTDKLTGITILDFCKKRRMGKLPSLPICLSNIPY